MRNIQKWYIIHTNQNPLDKLTFVFASESYNQMFRRFNYIFQYSKFRKNQIQEINEVSLELQDQEKNLIELNQKQKNLLNDEVKESNKLLGLKSKQRKIISNLRQKEKDLRREINERKKSLEN